MYLAKKRSVALLTSLAPFKVSTLGSRRRRQVVFGTQRHFRLLDTVFFEVIANLLWPELRGEVAAQLEAQGARREGGGGAAAVRRSSLSHPGNRPIVVFSHNRCTVTYLFSLFGFALFLLKCPTNINRPHRAASCGSACRLLTEAGGWWSGFAAVRCRGGIKGDEGDGKLLNLRRCFVGFHLFMAFMVGVRSQLCLIFSRCHKCFFLLLLRRCCRICFSESVHLVFLHLFNLNPPFVSV